jgi:hypothetical protein
MPPTPPPLESFDAKTNMNQKTPQYSDTQEFYKKEYGLK